MSSKTWAQLEDAIDETCRKWHLEAPTIENSLPRRNKAKRAQTKAERTVTLRFRWRARPIELTVSRWDTAVENLDAIARTLETVRLTEVRKLTDLAVLIYRQVHPTSQPAPPPPNSESQIPEHYRLLHVAPDAPLTVCDAAYRALARQAHPDQGGDTLTMQRLNGAIERIRKEKG